VLFYQIDSEKEHQMTKPQTTNRIVTQEATYFSIRLCEVSIDRPDCEKFSIECENGSKKYKSREYYQQTNRVRLHNREQFQVGFEPQQ
jgi:hypothetical protein